MRALVVSRDFDIGNSAAAEIDDVRHGEGLGGERRFGFTFKQIATDFRVAGSALNELRRDFVRHGRGIRVAEAAGIRCERGIEQGKPSFPEFLRSEDGRRCGK